MVTIRYPVRLACLGVAPFAIPIAMIAVRAADSTVDTLARDVERAEAVRAVKDLHNYSKK